MQIIKRANSLYYLPITKSNMLKKEDLTWRKLLPLHYKCAFGIFLIANVTYLSECYIQKYATKY